MAEVGLCSVSALFTSHWTSTSVAKTPRFLEDLKRSRQNCVSFLHIKLCYGKGPRGKREQETVILFSVQVKRKVEEINVNLRAKVTSMTKRHKTAFYVPVRMGTAVLSERELFSLRSH